MQDPYHFNKEEFMKPVNGNVLVRLSTDRKKNSLLHLEAEKNLKVAEVLEVSMPWYIEGKLTESTFKKGDQILYKPRDLTMVGHGTELKGFIHEFRVISIV